MAGVLVTGAGGFVGSAVTRRLVEWLASGDAQLWDGTPLTAVHALLRPGGSTAALAPIAGLSGWQAVHADMRDGEALAVLLRTLRPKAVLHLGFAASGFAALHEATAQHDHLGPLTALFAGLDRPATRFVHTSSAWVLAPGDQLDEAAATDPRLAYAAIKLRLDHEVESLGRATPVPWLTLRLFNVFGRYEAGQRLLPHLVDRLTRGLPAELTHGEQVRDFSDVDHIAEAYRLALVAPPAACRSLYHIGSGQGRSVREIAEIVRARLGAPVSLIRFDVAQTRDHRLERLVCNPARAVAGLGWQPRPEVTPGLHAAVDWWLAQRPTNR